MNEPLQKALEFANYRQTFAIQHKTIKEKIDAKLTIGWSNGIFKIDQSLITFVEMLITKGRTTDVPLIDSNGNPVLIENLENFKTEIFDRYFSACHEYFQEYEKLKKSRSVEALLNIWKKDV